jgi:hypothetical protein
MMFAFEVSSSKFHLMLQKFINNNQLIQQAQATVGSINALYNLGNLHYFLKGKAPEINLISF